MPDGKDYYTSAEVAAMFDVHVHTVIRWAHEGRLPTRKMPGSKIRFPRTRIDQMYAQYKGDDTSPQNGRTTPS
jgi:excisionase family DNA binding protein